MTLTALGVRAGMAWLALGVPATGALAQEFAVTGAGGRPAISAPTETIRSLTDYRTLPDVSEGLAEFLEINASLPGSVTAGPVSAVAAHQNLRALFTGDENLAFLQAAQNAPQLKSAEAANGVALAYFATGRGAAGLACLLVARDRAPQDPGVLLNLAAGALAFKQANEGLALLAEAERLGPLPAGPWGLSGALRADYLKGYAFMLLGDYPRARSLLTRVSAAAPELKEAALTLALVDARLGQDPRQSYLQGVWRGRVRLMVRNPEEPTTEAEIDHLPDAFTEGDQVGPALADIYNVTSGRAGQLRVLRVPTSPAQLREFGELSRQLLTEDRQEADGFRDAMVQAQTAFQKGPGSKLYKERMNQLYSLADECEQFSPEGARAVRRYRFQAKAYLDRMKEVRTTTMAAQMALTLKPHPKLEQELNEKAQAAITALMPHLRDYLRAIDDRYFLESTYLHGMLAHIGAPELRRALQAEGEYLRLTRQIEQIGAINELIAVAAVAKPSPLDPVVVGQKGSGQACSDEDAKWSVSVDLEVVGVSVSCKSVSFELEAPLGPPLASLSAELSVDLSGSVTVFAGPKAGVAGIGSTKGGLYLTANSEGIQDIGGKVEASASSGFGPVGVSHQVGESTVSFFPGPDQGAAPGGLPVFDGR